MSVQQKKPSATPAFAATEDVRTVLVALDDLSDIVGNSRLGSILLFTSGRCQEKLGNRQELFAEYDTGLDRVMISVFAGPKDKAFAEFNLRQAKTVNGQSIMCVEGGKILSLSGQLETDTVMFDEAEWFGTNATQARNGVSHVWGKLKSVLESETRAFDADEAKFAVVIRPISEHSDEAKSSVSPDQAPT